MNEYRERLLGLLGADSPFEVLEATPARVVSLVERMGEKGLDTRFAPGKWTGREVVAHLADVEIGTGFRIRQMVSEPNHARSTGHTSRRRRGGREEEERETSGSRQPPSRSCPRSASAGMSPTAGAGFFVEP